MRFWLRLVTYAAIFDRVVPADRKAYYRAADLEQRGDYAKALQSYQQFFQFDVVTSGEPLKVSLAWTDEPGSAGKQDQEIERPAPWS